MKNRFSTAIFGYKKDDINRFFNDLKKDYEDELFRKKERLTELNEENRLLKQEIEELKRQIKEFAEQEKCIAKALIVAQQNAQAIIEEGQQQIKQEMYQIKLEKNKWGRKVKQARDDLIKFDNQIIELMEKFRSELNYYMSKEISEVMLYDDEHPYPEEEDIDSESLYNLGELNEVLSDVKKVIT